jgi:hypothetical protein
MQGWSYVSLGAVILLACDSGSSPACGVFGGVVNDGACECPAGTAPIQLQDGAGLACVSSPVDDGDLTRDGALGSKPVVGGGDGGSAESGQPIDGGVHNASNDSGVEAEPSDVGSDAAQESNELQEGGNAPNSDAGLTADANPAKDAGVQEQCDSQVRVNWFCDKDADGFAGKDATSVTRCSLPLTTAECARWTLVDPRQPGQADCDEGNATAYPDANPGLSKVPGGSDLNCDGQITKLNFGGQTNLVSYPAKRALPICRSTGANTPALLKAAKTCPCYMPVLFIAGEYEWTYQTTFDCAVRPPTVAPDGVIGGDVVRLVHLASEECAVELDADGKPDVYYGVQVCQ